MNELLLSRLLLQARLSEDDVAARLGVAPKTVRQWLDGRVPYPANRAAMADLLGVTEADLWPSANGTLTACASPGELAAVYPRREAVPREVWIRFFASAEREIGILANSALFLAESVDTLHLLTEKGRAGVTVRIALGDPESRQAAERSEGGDIGDVTPAATRTALALFRPLNDVVNIQVRLHKTVLYNSIYRADDQMLINQHAYRIPAAHAPVLCLRGTGGEETTTLYLESFERLWAGSVPLVV